jgi:hypothetical protein
VSLAKVARAPEGESQGEPRITSNQTITAPAYLTSQIPDHSGGHGRRRATAKLEVSGARLEWGETKRLVGVPTPLTGTSKHAREP